MMPGYHLLLRLHARNEVLNRIVDIPKPELAIDYMEVRNPIIPPVRLRPGVPAKQIVTEIKTLDDIAYAGTGVLVDRRDFPLEGWYGPSLPGV